MASLKTKTDSKVIGCRENIEDVEILGASPKEIRDPMCSIVNEDNHFTLI